MYDVPLFLGLGLPAAHSAGFYLCTSPALIGSGVFTGLKNSATMFIAALLAYGVIGPAIVCKASNKAFSLDTILAGCTEGGYMGLVPLVSALFCTATGAISLLFLCTTRSPAHVLCCPCLWLEFLWLSFLAEHSGSTHVLCDAAVVAVGLHRHHVQRSNRGDAAAIQIHHCSVLDWVNAT